MKKIFNKTALAFVMILAMFVPILGACGQGDNSSSGTSKGEKVNIGVLVYDTSDSQVLAFQRYYDEYIAEHYDVSFIFSNSITTAEDERAAIENFAAQNVKAVIAFAQADIVAAINEAARAGMYYIVGIGTMTDEQFEQVKDNEFFLGTIGPDLTSEEEVGYKMARHYIEQGDTNFVIYAGGVSHGVDAHRMRFEGIIRALEEEGVVYHQPSGGSFIGEFESDEFTIQVMEGFPDDAGAFYTEAQQKLGKPGVQTLLTVGVGLEIFGATIANINPDINLATVAAFTDAYREGFEADPQQVDWLAGTFPSMIGPTFAAVMNAINGDAEAFRDNGQAFRIPQSYWIAESTEKFEQIFELAYDFENPAINNQDIDQLIKKSNPDVTLEFFKEFASNTDVDSILNNISERD